MANNTCINCGRPIPKDTVHVHFGSLHNRSTPRWIDRVERPKDRKEAEATVRTFSNHSVVSVSRSADRSAILSVGIWDGESRVDPFFCTLRCGSEFGHAAASAGYRRKVKA